MFQSQTYVALFKELYDGARETGPFTRDWSNVPVVKDHALQNVKIKNEKERAKYERLVVFCWKEIMRIVLSSKTKFELT